MLMTHPINLRCGLIQVTLYLQKRFDTRDDFHEIDPEELGWCWNSLKHTVDGIVDEQISRSRSLRNQNTKIQTVIDIHNALYRKTASKITVDENVLLDEVLKTGNFSEEEAKSLIKKVREEKMEDGLAWY